MTKFGDDGHDRRLKGMKGSLDWVSEQGCGPGSEDSSPDVSGSGVISGVCGSSGCSSNPPQCGLLVLPP